jgi:hypothetical protein
MLPSGLNQTQLVNIKFSVKLGKNSNETCAMLSEVYAGEAMKKSNTPAHKTLSVEQFLAQKSITEMEHPPCSLDLVPNDIWLFPKTKSALNGQRFQVTEDVQKEMTMALKAIPQQKFQKCFQQWQHH